MASGDFAYGSPADFLNSDQDGFWQQDSSQYLNWGDSPQPDDSLQQFDLGNTDLEYVPGASTLSNVMNMSDHNGTAGGVMGTASPSAFTKQPPALPQGVSGAPSVTSEHSSHSSNSENSGARKREMSSTSSSPAAATTAAARMSLDQPAAPRIKMGYSGFGEADEGFQYGNSTLPSVGAGIDNLSLSNAGTTSHSPSDFKFNAPSPDPLNTSMFTGQGMDSFMPQHNLGGLRPVSSAAASPQMTIQPSKMFVIGEDMHEDSPDAMNMMNTMDDSNNMLYNSPPPMPMTTDTYSGTLPPEVAMRRPTFGNTANAGFTGVPPPTTLPSAHSSHKVIGGEPPTRWQCKLTVDPIPDKSRVETQIPIRLTLHNAPKSITKLHLPSYTISKPKFQAKPPFTKSEDSLELQCMLVCASAMQKDGLQAAAFQRAAQEDPDVSMEDVKASSPSSQADENDPLRPLNGGPVQICQGCIVRERKRAARKKTKKQDEEEEWAKDEARRVIVFNCPEVRDWCVPGTKETSVKEHDGPVDQMFVNAPMRIACYCRHQSEKVGFQVIFTLRTSSGNILAQAMSESIMITDDHKQPTAGSHPPVPFPGNNPISSAGTFNSNQFNMYPTFQQDMPFRTSWSTNDLRTLNQYAPQRRPPNFQRQNSSSYAPSQASTVASTATATPRNLSRPASPTSPSGHSQKKRRSGMGTHTKLPAGLTMTRMDETASTPTTNNFSFNSPSAYSSTVNTPFAPANVATPDQFATGPSTPMTGTVPNGMFSAANINDAYEFWSAPTSQHASRAPSPLAVSRQPSFSAAGGVPQQAANALFSLPPSMDLTRPPNIQRVVPNSGPRRGGDEVTVLGSNFCQGLDVMFGDKMATNTTFWGDTTLVCRAPPSMAAGAVPVVFKHQHHSAPPELQQIQNMMPARLTAYTYLDDSRHQMQAAMMMLQQQQQNVQAMQNLQSMQGRDLSQISPEELQRAFMMNQAMQAGYGRGGPPRRMPQQRTQSSSVVNTVNSSTGTAPNNLAGNAAPPQGN